MVENESGTVTKNMTGRTVNGVRPGQRRPFRKATNAEVQRRTEWLALKLAIQPTLKEGEIKAMMRAEYGLQWQRSLQYITRAKALIKDHANVSREQAKQIAVTALLDMIQNETGVQRTAAIRLWIDVFGLDAPRQMRVGDPDGKPLVPTVVAPKVQFIFPTNPRRDGISASNGSGHPGKELLAPSG
jgi:hypothetical protein